MPLQAPPATSPPNTGRRTPGPHASRPRVADAIRRCAASFEAAARHGGRAGFHDYLDAFCGQAGTYSDVDTAVRTVVSDVTEAGEGSLEEALAAVDATLTASGQGDGDVDACIGDLVERSVDGERLAWAVITIESARHIPLVRKEAHKAARVWNRQAEDLETYGWRGLRLALRNYQPDSWLFSTYACPKIRGAIHDGVRSEHHLPKRLTTFVNKVERGRDELASVLGRNPTLAEVAERVGADIEQLNDLPRFATPASLDESDSDADGPAFAGGVDVESHVEESLRRQAVSAALEQLAAPDAEAVRILVLEGCSYAEARRRTGVSHRQLKARRDRGLAALQVSLADWV